MKRKKIKKFLDPEFVYRLIKTPETSIQTFDLIYVHKNDLIIRRKKRKSEFIYLLNNHEINDEHNINRINELTIPPSWKKVKISKVANGHLQAVGRDNKLRKQYIYHQLWSKIRNQAKFFKMVAFGKQLPKIRAQVIKDLSQKGWPKSKTIALVISLMEETHIRIGNEQYEKRNQTYGLSTMRKRHIELSNEKVEFNFIGKKGKEHSITLNDKKLIKLIRKCEEIPGWELFKYYDENGEKHSIESGMINEYLHAITNEIFTAKDFRTWAATIIFFEALYEIGISKKKKKRKKNVLKAYDKTAAALGNTRNVCRKYYVHPAIPHKYLTGSIAIDFKALDMTNDENDNLSQTEHVVLNLIENYMPSFLPN